LYRAGEHQIQTSRAIASVQARQMRASIREARRSADVAENALTKLQRAFLFPHEVQPTIIHDENRVWSWIIRFEWQNTGSSPAKDMRLHVSWEHFQDDIPEDFTFPDVGLQVHHPVYLPPKGKTMTGPLEIDVAVLEAVRVGHIRPFFWGWATYRDIFEGTPLHITKFFREILIKGDELYSPKGQIQVSFTSYRRHNCLDEDCN
jgi:hypothetical protein